MRPSSPLNRHENDDFNFGFSNGGHGCARSGKVSALMA
jgi:hypothetical protein